MLNPEHFRSRVIRPCLKRIGLWSATAERLLIGTALVESDLTWLTQHRGPALGIFMVEPQTHRDIWNNFLAFRLELAAKVRRLASEGIARDDQLVWNLGYATAIARLVYYRRPEPLPAADDIDGLAAYWKDHYNTEAGRGRVEHFVAKAGPVLQGLA